METIAFSQNWNNKLSGKAFTTIRLHNPHKYKLGETYAVSIKDKPLGVVALVDLKKITVRMLDNFTARLDTGYSANETVQILKQMYKNKSIDWSTQILDVCLLVYQTKQEKKPQPNLFD